MTLREKIAFRIKLMDDWKDHLWKAWSVRINALALLLTSWIATQPDQVLELWRQLPAEVTSHFHPTIVLWLPVILNGAAMYARIVKQSKLEKK